MSLRCRIAPSIILAFTVYMLAPPPAVAYEAEYDGLGGLEIVVAIHATVIVGSDGQGNVTINDDFVPVDGGTLLARMVTGLQLMRAPDAPAGTVTVDLSLVQPLHYSNLSAENIVSHLDDADTYTKSPISAPPSITLPCGGGTVPLLTLTVALMYLFISGPRRARRSTLRRARQSA